MLTLLHTFTGHQNPVYSLAFSDKPGILFSAGNDKGIVEWSLKKMAFVMVKWPVKSSVYCLHSYNNQLFAGERSGQFTAFDFIKQEIAANIKAHQQGIFAMVTLPEKKELLTAGEDGEVAVWSLENWQEVYRFRVSDTTVRTIAVSPDQRQIVFGCKDNDIYMYNADDFSYKYTLTGHELPVTSLAYHPNGKLLLSGGRDARLRVWDAGTHELLQTIPAHMFAIYDIAIHPSLPYFATASQDKSIKIWGLDNYKLYKILSREKTGTGHTHSVNKLAWSADGQYLVSTGDDKQVLVWGLG